jgi:VWFA-related protein
VSSDGCVARECVDGRVAQATYAAKLDKKCYPRAMKSLREIAVFCGYAMGCALLSACATCLAAQTPQTPPVGPDGAQSGSSGSASKPVPPSQQPPAATPSGTPAQTPPGRAPGTISVNVAVVVIPVTVKDRGGRLVPDLHRDEFRIFEDNVEQKNFKFTAEAFPLSMVVLIDNDLKAKYAEQVEASIKAVVAGMSAADEASICRFDQFFHEGKGFTTNQDRLLTELTRTQIDESRPNVAAPGGPFNGPTINGQAAPGVNQPDQYPSTRAIGGQHTKTIDDAVYAAGQLLEDRGHDRRKIILLISDGQNGAKFNTNPYDNVVKELLRNNISVFSVAVGGAFFERKFTRLTEYTHATGGDTYYALKRGTMEELYSRITEEARHQYTLTYSPVGTDRAKDYHSLEVRVEREGLNVTARQGYYSSGLQK